MTPAELLTPHVGHRLSLVEPVPGRTLSIKCFTCAGRLIDLASLLALRPASARTTSTSTPPSPRDPKPSEQCPQHLGEYAGACRSCAADRIAHPDGTPPPASQVRQGTDPGTVPEWQAAREELARKARERRHAQAAATPATEPGAAS